MRIQIPPFRKNDPRLLLLLWSTTALFVTETCAHAAVPVEKSPVASQKKQGSPHDVKHPAPVGQKDTPLMATQKETINVKMDRDARNGGGE